MEQNKRPLFSLTVEEFIELNKSINLDQIRYHVPEKIEAPKSDIIYADEVSVIANYTKSTLYSKVNRGEIPYVSGGRPLTFSRKEIIEWIQNGRPCVAEILANKFLKLKSR